MADRKFSLTKFAHKWHTRFMYFVGIQFFIWGLTGLYMVSIDIHDIHGDNRVSTAPNVDIANATYSLQSLIKRYPKFSAIELVQVFEQPHFLVTPNAYTSESLLINANTGIALPKLTIEQIRSIANARVQPRADIISITLLDETPSYVTSRFGSTYEVRFDTFDNLHFYIQANTGEIFTKRHNLWHIFDWMWRFHIMDYDDGANTHHWFLQTVAALSLIAFVFGAGLLWARKRFTKQALIQNRPVYKHMLTLHKWMALIVSIQVFLWLVSGLYLSLVEKPDLSPLPSLPVDWGSQFTEDDSFASLWQEAVAAGQKSGTKETPIIKAELVNAFGQARALFTFSEGYHRYFASERLSIFIGSGSIEQYRGSMGDINGALQSNERLPAMNDKPSKTSLEWFASQLPVPISDISFIQAGESEIRGEMNALWRLGNEHDGVSYYMDAHTGELVAQLNDALRLRDLMLRLHFMDYFSTGHFNHLWNIALAFFMLVLSASGLVFSARHAQLWFSRWRRV